MKWVKSSINIGNKDSYSMDNRLLNHPMNGHARTKKLSPIAFLSYGVQLLKPIKSSLHAHINEQYWRL